MLRKMVKIAACGWVLLAAVQIALAQPTVPASAPSPASQPDAIGLRVVIVEVHGLVQIRANAHSPWQMAINGMGAGEGAELRTGPHSSVTCAIPPDQTFTLDRLGVVKVAEAMQQGNKASTRLVMPYGRTTYQLQSSGPEYDSEILTPSSTVAVRGTTVSVYDQPPFEPEAISFTGRALFRTARGEVALGSKGGTKASIRADQGSAAETARRDVVVDPVNARTRTASEAKRVQAESSNGGLSDIESIVREAPDFSFQGPLVFTLQWKGNSNVGLETVFRLGNPVVLFTSGRSPFNQAIFPVAGIDVTANGVQTTGERTVQTQQHGLLINSEQIFFDKLPTTEGIFSISAVSLSGPPVDVSLTAFADGKAQDIYFLGGPRGHELLRTHELDERVSPNHVETGLVIIPEFTHSSVPYAGDRPAASPGQVPQTIETNVPQSPAIQTSPDHASRR